MPRKEIMRTPRIQGAYSYDDGSTLSWRVDHSPLDHASLLHSSDAIAPAAITEDNNGEEELSFGPMTEEHWTALAISQSHAALTDFKLLLPIQRFCKSFTTVDLPQKDLSVFELLSLIYRHYNEVPIGLTNLQQIDDDDVFGYVERAMKRAREGKTVHYIDVMGDSVYYEGLEVSYHGIRKQPRLSLMLGS